MDKKGRPRKNTPNINHKYILEFLSILYNYDIQSWCNIDKMYIYKVDLVENGALQKCKDVDIMSKLRDIFRIHQIPKLRVGPESEADLITILRCIGRIYNYELKTFHNKKRKSVYIMSFIENK